MEWTDQRIELLRKFWSQGLTASAIAKALGGISRNAVIGKAHRLGLMGRPSPIKRDKSGASPRRKSAAKRLASIQPKPILEKPKDAAAALGATTEIPAPAPKQSYATTRIHGGTKNCSWPVGDPKQPDFQFCGEPSAAGRPYCEKHCAAAYQRKSEAAA